MTANTALVDAYELPITAASERAAERYRAAQICMLAMGADPGALLEEALAEDPDFALAHAALALVRVRELRMAEARGAVESAAVLAPGTTPREQSHIRSVSDAVAGRSAAAIHGIVEHLNLWPRDALLLSHAGTGLLFSGRQHEIVRLTETVRPAYGDDWYFLGLHAFGLEEVRCYDEARVAAERSLERFPAGAFTVHALAHVFFETGAYGSGAAFLPGWMAGYDRRAGMHLHLSWHHALFLLAQGEHDAILALYERDIRPQARLDAAALYDPVSLLWRLDLLDRGRSSCWNDVEALASRRATQPGMVFADLHHGMALAATGRQNELSSLYDSLRARSDAGDTAAEVALPLLQGMAAFAAGDFAEAVRTITPVEPRIYLVGGSHAQREVFHDTLIEALLRCGQHQAVENRLRERLSRRPRPRDFYLLDRARAASGEA